MEKTLLKDLKERLNYLKALESFVEKSEDSQRRKEENASFIKGMIYELDRIIEKMEYAE